MIRILQIFILLLGTRLLAASVTASSVTSIHSSPPSLGIREPAMGLSAHFKRPDEEQFSIIKSAGFNWLRLDLAWSDTEKAKGVYDFSDFDGLAKSLHSHGISVVVILAYGNPLYVNPGDPPGARNRADTEEFRQAFARWAAAAVSRYAKYNFIWELWNEPNSSKFWPPKKDAHEYVRLITAACSAIHAQTPTARLIGPGTTGVDIPFIRVCLEGGLLKYWSAISVHPYRDSPPETVRESYRKLRNEIAKHTRDGTPVPIVCSEWGYPSDGSEDANSRQADYLARVVDVNYSEKIPLTFWYTWTPHFDDPGDWKFALAVRKNRNNSKTPLQLAPAFDRVSKVLSQKNHKP